MSAHSGHRQRMRNKFLKSGISCFEPHEILELLLFYACPRVDTNKTAHALMDTFQSISAVFDAPIGALIKVDGIGENAAVLIKLFSELIRVYEIDHNCPKSAVLDSSDKVGEYLVPYFAGLTEEVVYALLLDSSLRAIACVKLFEGNIREAQINVRKFFDAAVRFNAPNIVISHNHPSGIALPSQDDISTTSALYSALKTLDVNLVDHIIVSADDYVSLRDSCVFDRF